MSLTIQDLLGPGATSDGTTSDTSAVPARLAVRQAKLNEMTELLDALEPSLKDDACIRNNVMWHWTIEVKRNGQTFAAHTYEYEALEGDDLRAFAQAFVERANHV
jgi:hypothetical protein